MFSLSLSLSLSQHVSRRSTLILEDTQQPGYKCLFITHLQLETETLHYKPDVHKFQQILADTVEQFQDCTLALPNLIPDTFFNAFTRYCSEHCTIKVLVSFIYFRPTINQKQEEKTCGEGPSLAGIFEDDNELMKLAQNIQVRSVHYMTVLYIYIIRTV